MIALTPSNRLRLLLALGALGALALSSSATAAPRAAATASASDGIARALASGRLTPAEYALERALALVRPERARRLFGDVATPDPRAATGILRELAARESGLPRARRAEAERLLARPTSPTDPFVRYRAPARRVCDTRMCFWWVRTTRDAPSLYDGNRNRIPDWVDRARAEFRKVWRAEVGSYGYRAPRSDLSSKAHGPNGKLDIYIADVGAYGLYGYCTSDDPRRRYRRTVSAYCVVDDDFSRRQFTRGAHGLAALRVTAAHEFFHAVQFAYDWLEDLWLVEGTAAWIEDEVYDRINDNRRYLAKSPIARTGFWRSLDWYDRRARSANSLYKYGSWIWFRYLSERYGRDVVRAIWRRADATAGAPNEYSMKAVMKAIALRGDDGHDVFGDFGAANAYPDASYSEGSAYPTPQPTSDVVVDATGVAVPGIPMDHMSSDYYRFAPDPGLAPTDSLEVSLTLPAATASPRARVLAEAQDGTVTSYGITPGTSEILVPGFGALAHATLVLTNASTRYTCLQGTQLSCRGTPLDDTEFSFSATIVP